MCLLWRIRQRKLDIDDYGSPLHPAAPESPVAVTQTPSDGTTIQEAIEDAVDTDVHAGPAADATADEETPLLKKAGDGEQGSWFAWLRPSRR